MSKSRFGPAGLFSTDNPAADQRQIDAESYVDELEKEDEFWREYDPQEDGDLFEFGDDFPEVDYIFGSCLCGWTGSGMFWQGDAEDKEVARQRLYQDHANRHPECDLTPTLG